MPPFPQDSPEALVGPLKDLKSQVGVRLSLSAKPLAAVLPPPRPLFPSPLPT